MYFHFFETTLISNYSLLFVYFLENTLLDFKKYGSRYRYRYIYIHFTELAILSSLLLLSFEKKSMRSNFDVL